MRSAAAPSWCDDVVKPPSGAAGPGDGNRRPGRTDRLQPCGGTNIRNTAEIGRDDRQDREQGPAEPPVVITFAE